MAMDGMADMIERMWLHLEESAATLLQFAVLPVLKILVLCSFGLALASRKINILPAASRKLLSKVSNTHTLFSLSIKIFVKTVIFMKQLLSLTAAGVRIISSLLNLHAIGQSRHRSGDTGMVSLSSFQS